MHHHNAEHLIEVRQTGIFYRNCEDQLMGGNQSTIFPLRYKNSLASPGKIPVELIGQQSGDYLGEDDTTLFQDRFGRSYPKAVACGSIAFL